MNLTVGMESFLRRMTRGMQGLSWATGGGGLETMRGKQGNAPHSGAELPVDSTIRALQLSGVWRACRLITELVGMLPCGVYAKSADGSLDLAEDHYLTDLLTVSPNLHMTPTELFESATFGLTADGNGYVEIDRNGVGRPVSLWPWLPTQVQMVVAPGEIYYLVRNERGLVREVPEKNMLHFKLFGNGLRGLSPLGYAARSLGNMWTVTDNAARFNAKGGKPSGVLMVDHVLKPQQRTAVRENFAELEKGGDAGSALFVLEAGMKYQALTISPAEQQMMEQLRWGLADIARVWGVPLHLLMETEKSTSWGTGLEQQNLGLLTYTLEPYLNRMQQSIRAKCLMGKEAKNHVIGFDRSILSGADQAARATFYAQMVQNGLMTRNEVRVREKLPKFKDGDQLTVQTNLTPIEQLMKLAEAAAQSKTPKPPSTQPVKQ